MWKQFSRYLFIIVQLQIVLQKGRIRVEKNKRLSVLNNNWPTVIKTGLQQYALRTNLYCRNLFRRRPNGTLCRNNFIFIFINEL